MGRTREGAKGVEVTPVAVAPSAPEAWLVERLVHTAGLDRTEVLGLTSEQAVDAWTDFISRRR